MNYRVGYRKPPAATQFKKGRSGNPRGRPKKKATSLLQYLNELEAKPVAVRKNGKSVLESGYSVALQQLIRRICNGDPQAWKELHAAEKRHRSEKPKTNYIFIGGLPDQSRDA